MWYLSSQPGIELMSPALEAQSLNHWTTRDVPFSLFSEVSGADINLLCLSRNWSVHFKTKGAYSRKGQDPLKKKIIGFIFTYLSLTS